MEKIHIHTWIHVLYMYSFIDHKFPHLSHTHWYDVQTSSLEYKYTPHIIITPTNKLFSRISTTPTRPNQTHRSQTQFAHHLPHITRTHTFTFPLTLHTHTLTRTHTHTQASLACCFVSADAFASHGLPHPAKKKKDFCAVFYEEVGTYKKDPF